MINPHMSCGRCGFRAALYCEAQGGAYLCWFCDAAVHGTRDDLSHHIRTLLCTHCGDWTVWKVLSALPDMKSSVAHPSMTPWLCPICELYLSPARSCHSSNQSIDPIPRPSCSTHARCTDSSANIFGAAGVPSSALASIPTAPESSRRADIRNYCDSWPIKRTVDSPVMASAISYKRSPLEKTFSELSLGPRFCTRDRIPASSQIQTCKECLLTTAGAVDIVYAKITWLSGDGVSALHAYVHGRPKARRSGASSACLSSAYSNQQRYLAPATAASSDIRNDQLDTEGTDDVRIDIDCSEISSELESPAPIPPESILEMLQLWHRRLHLSNSDTIPVALDILRRLVYALDQPGLLNTEAPVRDCLAVALWMAAKAVETQPFIPKASRVALVSGVSAPRLLALEVPILDLLDWRIPKITSAGAEQGSSCGHTSRS